MDPKDMLSWKQVIMDSYLLLPLVVLIAFLVIGYSPFGACTYAIASSFLISFFRKDTRLSPKKLFQIFEKSGYNCIMLGVTCAGAGMVVAVVTYTGLALGIATAIQSFSGGLLLPALILVMLTCLLLGMGLPCTPAYIIAVTIGGPAMMALGIDVLPAHLFVFYFAIMAEVTPPVCIASYCGAAIAGTKPLATGVESSLIAIMGYLIPFIFVYNQALILRGTALDILATFLLGVIISGLWAATFSGYLFKTMTLIFRVLLGLVTSGLVILVCNVKIMTQVAPQIAIIILSVIALSIFFMLNKKAVQAAKAAMA